MTQLPHFESVRWLDMGMLGYYVCMEIYLPLDCYLDIISNGGFVYLYPLGISIMYEVVHSRNIALSNIPLRAPFSPFEIRKRYPATRSFVLQG